MSQLGSRVAGVCLGALLLASCNAPTPEHAKASVPRDERPSRERIAEAESLLAANPQDTEALFRLGLGWQDDKRTGAPDSAVAAFEKLVNLEPSSVQAAVHYGLALEEAKRHEEALAQYERATVLAPDDPLPYINLGSLLYFQFKRTNDAKVALSKALELDPDNPDAHFNMGVLFADANLFREAKVEWEEVIRVQKEGPAATLAAENLARIQTFLDEIDPEPASEGTKSP